MGEKIEAVRTSLRGGLVNRKLNNQESSSSSPDRNNFTVLAMI